MTNRPVFRDISIQFSSWNDRITVGVQGEWLRLRQNEIYILDLYFEGASQESLEAAAAALRKLLPVPSEPDIEEPAWDDAS